MSVSHPVLIIDDDPTTLSYLTAIVEESGREASATASGVEGLRLARTGRSRILLLDWIIPDLCGLEITRRLREDPDLDYYYIIMLSIRCDRDSVLQAFDAGVDDFLRKPTDPAEIIARLHTAERIVTLQQKLIERTRMLDRVNGTLVGLNEQLTRIANQDGLTGLLTRREVLERLELIWGHALDHHNRIACAMLDVDHFKKLNDTYGHAAGDQALRQLARRLRQIGRASDIIGRLGGDEFIIVFPGLDARAAEQLLLPLMSRDAGKTPGSDYPGADPGFAITSSIGVAERNNDMRVPQELIEAADAALYRAKAGGRGRIAGPLIEHNRRATDEPTTENRTSKNRARKSPTSKHPEGDGSANGSRAA